jgi:plastocyanin
VKRVDGVQGPRRLGKFDPRRGIAIIDRQHTEKLEQGDVQRQLHAASDRSASTEEGASSEATTKPGGEAARAEKVRIVEFFYDPDPVRIQVGGKVIWQNEDTIPHTASAEDGSFDTGTIKPGKLKSETFKQAGSYRYVCEIHPRMSGTVEVVEKG